MRWIKRIWTAALVMAATAGCKQQCFITEKDYNHALEHLGAALDTMPEAGRSPAECVIHTPTPKTIFDLNRPSRYLSLAEAISVALEKGTRGSLALNGQGDDTQAIASFQ